MNKIWDTYRCILKKFPDVFHCSPSHGRIFPKAVTFDTSRWHSWAHCHHISMRPSFKLSTSVYTWCFGYGIMAGQQFILDFFGPSPRIKLHSTNLDTILEFNIQKCSYRGLTRFPVAESLRRCMSRPHLTWVLFRCSMGWSPSWLGEKTRGTCGS